MPSVAAFIVEAHEEIHEDFVREVGSLPSGRGLTHEELLDSLPDYLGILRASSESDGSRADRAGERREMEESHALLRLRQGFQAREAEAEYDLVLRLVVSRWEHRPAGDRPDPAEVGRLIGCLVEARRRVRQVFDEYTQGEQQREKHYVRLLERHAQQLIASPGQSVPLVRRLEPILSVLQEATGAEGCALHLAQPAGGRVSFTASVGAGGGPSGYLSTVLEGQPFRSRVLGSFLSIAGSTRMDGQTRHALGMRLPSHGTLQGAVVVGSTGRFSRRQRRDFESLTERLAGIVVRTRLFERLPTRHGTVRVPGRQDLRDLVGEVERSRLRFLVFGLYEADLATGDLAWSEGASTLLGYPIDELGPDMDWWRQQIHPDDRLRVLASLQEALARGAEDWQEEYRLLSRDSGYLLVADRALIVRDGDGQPVRIIGAFQNIGAQREAEQALRASEERLNLAIRAAGMGAWDYDPDADRFHWDEPIRALEGVGPDLTIDLSVFVDLVHPDDRERVRAAVHRALAPEGPGEFDEEYRLETGRWLRTTGRAFFENGHPYRFIGVTQDVSAIHEATDALARRERQFRVLAEAMPQLVWTATPEGRLDYVNRRCVEYAGRPSDALLGARWFEIVHPEDVEQVQGAWREAVAAGSSYEVKQRIRAADGTYGWFLTRAVPIRDAPEGPVRTWFGTGTEITEMVRAEEVLRKSNEFAQQLLGIVSHDLRNPLNAMLVGAQMLLRSGDLDPRQARTASRILTAGERAVRLVSDLLDLTRARLGQGIPIAPTELDFDAAVDRVIDEARLAHPSRTIRFVAGGSGRGRWDPDRIAQVVTNLLSNAISYSDPGTAICVETGSVGDRVELRVHNRGVPIPPDLLPRIFEPMLRGPSAKSTTGGLGMGLFIVDLIVRSHGGQVEVVSTEEAGTTFRVSLPRQPGPEADSRPA